MLPIWVQRKQVVNGQAAAPRESVLLAMVGLS
jgi:hypothetical protein